jgi:hypothetical protein
MMFLMAGSLHSISANGLQISEGTNSVGIVRWNLGFCLCAVIGCPSFRININNLNNIK